MPFNFKLKRTKRYDVSSKYEFVVGVHMLDNSFLECSLRADCTGHDCLETISHMLKLEESEYFGFRYVTKKLQFHWIHLDKPLKKQLDKHAHISRLYFGVMFYISTAHRIDDNRARFNYFLQLKSDVLDSRISCSSEQAIRLAAYYLQAELGHHDPEQHTLEMFKDVQILPKHMTKDDSITLDLLQEVLYLHHNLVGLHPAVAVIYYIKLAQTLDGYGMEYFTAKDDSGKELYLGTSSNGIFARYLNGQQALSFRWSVIAHIGHNKKCVTIDTQKTSIQYYLEDTEMAKYFQQIAGLLQKFYRSFKPISSSLTDLSDMGSISSAQEFQATPPSGGGGGGSVGSGIQLDSLEDCGNPASTSSSTTTALYSHSPNYAMDLQQQPGVNKDMCNNNNNNNTSQPGGGHHDAGFVPDLIAPHYVNQQSDQGPNNVTYTPPPPPHHHHHHHHHHHLPPSSSSSHMLQQQQQQQQQQEQDLSYRKAMLPAYRPSPDYNQLMRQRLDNNALTSPPPHQSQPVYTTATMASPMVMSQHHHHHHQQQQQQQHHVASALSCGYAVTAAAATTTTTTSIAAAINTTNTIITTTTTTTSTTTTDDNNNNNNNMPHYANIIQQTPLPPLPPQQQQQQDTTYMMDYHHHHHQQQQQQHHQQQQQQHHHQQQQQQQQHQSSPWYNNNNNDNNDHHNNNFMVKPTHSSPELHTPTAAAAAAGHDYVTVVTDATTAAAAAAAAMGSAEDFAAHDQIYFHAPPPPVTPPPPYPRASNSTPDLAPQTVAVQHANTDADYGPDLVSHANLGVYGMAIGGGGGVGGFGGSGGSGGVGGVSVGPISLAAQSRLDKSVENLAAAVNSEVVGVSDADSLCSCNSSQTAGSGCGGGGGGGGGGLRDAERDFEEPPPIPSEIEKNNIHVRYIAPDDAPPPSKSKEVATLRESFRRMMIARSSPACLGRFKEKAKRSRQERIREDDDDDDYNDNDNDDNNDDEYNNNDDDDDDDVIRNVTKTVVAAAADTKLGETGSDSDRKKTADVVAMATKAGVGGVSAGQNQSVMVSGGGAGGATDPCKVGGLKQDCEGGDDDDDDKMGEERRSIGPLKMAAMNGLTLSRPIILSASEDENRAPKDERRKMLEGKLSEGCVLAEFEQIAKKAPNMECSFGRKPQNECKNRFPDVLPYDEVRVELTPTKHNPLGYINASHMKVSLGELEWCFIATQAPMENTAQDFWQMVWEQEIDVVAMLTGLKEQGKQRCHPYWPQEPGSDHKLRFGRYEVELQFSNNSWCYLTNRIALKDKSAGAERLVWHLQYTDWPDHGCPEDTYGFLGFLDEVESVQRLAESEEGSGKKSPIVVHCSAGVGRTGVVLLSVIMKSCLEHNLNVNIPLVLAKLRQQRMHTVQTLGQYSFVYKTLIRYLKNTRLI